MKIYRHLYPKDGRYRVSGQCRPQLGDVARCEHMKDIKDVDQSMPRCENCDRLARIGVAIPDKAW